MSALILIGRKLADIERAMLEAKAMDEKQRQLEASHPDFYDERLHNAGMSRAVQSIYTRMEDVLKDVLSLCDGSVPASATWHRDLLLQASTPVSGVRPRVIGDLTYASLTELLAFRHVVRGAYVVELRTADVRRNAALMFDAIPRAIGEIRSMSEAFFAERSDPDAGARAEP